MKFNVFQETHGIFKLTTPHANNTRETHVNVPIMCFLDESAIGTISATFIFFLVLCIVNEVYVVMLQKVCTTLTVQGV